MHSPARDLPEPPPSWGDPRLRLILALAAGLLGWSWSRIEGYELADAVEYLERAWAFSRGEPVIDNLSIRAFGFSALLLPFFLAARVLGLADLSWIPLAARGLQIALSLALIAVTARIAARAGGRLAGYAAALLLTASPVLLRWGVCPVSGVAAALFVALALERLLAPRPAQSPARTGFAAGAWLGASLLMAYQVVTVLAPIVLWAFVRFRRERGLRGALLGGILLFVLLQCTADFFYYGTFGISLGDYLLQNFFPNFAVLFYRAGRVLESRALLDFSQWLYNRIHDAQAIDFETQEQAKLVSATVRQSHARTWYLVHLPEALTWPGVVLFALGLARSLLRRSAADVLILLVVAVNVLATSLKGSKEFRLWLPFLPLVAVVSGTGLAWLAAGAASSARALALARSRALLGAAALAAAVALGAREMLARSPTIHGAYWRAMAWLNERAEHDYHLSRAAGQAQESIPRPAVASAFHWAVFLRESPRLKLEKLPWHLGYWDFYTSEQRAQDLEALGRMNYFLAHLPELTRHPELLREVARLFAVEAGFFDREKEGGAGPGPVLVFKLRPRVRAAGAPRERVLYELRAGPSEAGGAPPILEFRDPSGGAGLVRLLEYEYTSLPGDGWGWIRYRWEGGGLPGRDLLLIDRLLPRRGGFVWQNNHAPAYGQHPISTWGSTSGDAASLEEGYLVIPEQDPFRAAGGDGRFLGGAYRRGDLVPAELWIQIARLDELGRPLDVLAPVRPRDGLPLREIREGGPLPADDGSWVTPDGYARAGAVFLVRPPRALLPPPAAGLLPTDE